MKAVLNAKSGNAGRSSTGKSTLGRTLNGIGVEYIQQDPRGSTEAALLVKFYWGEGETFQVRMEGKDAQKLFKHANWLTRFTPEEPLSPEMEAALQFVAEKKP